MQNRTKKYFKQRKNIVICLVAIQKKPGMDRNTLKSCKSHPIWSGSRNYKTVVKKNKLKKLNGGFL